MEDLQKGSEKGRELDAKYFDKAQQKLFNAADNKEWRSFLETGAVEVIPPSDAKKIPEDRIFKRPARWVRTNKNKDDPLTDVLTSLQAKSRLVIPGDVDPDGAKPIEEGGFCTDAPTSPQLALHLLFSRAVRSGWRLKT